MSFQKITLIDYGMGNLWSVVSALKYLNCEVEVSSDRLKIENAEALVIPGVGSFRRGMNLIRELGIEESILFSTKERKVKILGICLGMQLMGIDSTEDGKTLGLNLIPAQVDKFSQNELGSLKLTHVGFDEVHCESDSILFNGIDDNRDFYFVHSYKMLPKDINGSLGICNYGIDFLASYEKDNIFATQFHPEKSQTNGLKLLENFLRF